MSLANEIKELMEIGFSRDEAAEMVKAKFSETKMDAKSFVKEVQSAEKEIKKENRAKKQEKKESVKRNKELGLGSRATNAIEGDYIQKLFNALKTDAQRLFFIVGVNTKLRSSDIIRLQVKHVRNPFNRIDIVEKKTGKPVSIDLNDIMVAAVKRYIPENASPEDYLFPSIEKKTKTNKKSKNKKTPYITHMTAYRWINDAANAIGLVVRDENGKLVKGYDVIGPHSMRKTWAIMAMENGSAQYVIQQALNHASWKVTELYLKMSEKKRSEIHKSTQVSVEF